MLEIQGKYNRAKIFTNYVDNGVIAQVVELLNQDFTKEAKIRIMPDTHQGVGCVIGFTADLGEKVVPNLVGVDIGCGMLTIELGNTHLDLKRLDEIINKFVPAGFSSHSEKVVDFPQLSDLHCYKELRDLGRIEKSVGTLGGGNHFIEANVDKHGHKYLVLHSGSRNLGHQVATYYQGLAIESCSAEQDYQEKRGRIIQDYKKNHKVREIQEALNELSRKHSLSETKYPRELCFLEGENKVKYLQDMNICQEYARLNRETMANIILIHLLGKDIHSFEYFHTVHNYIDFTDNIIRKGAISAYEGEKVLIPINMRDGSILAIGKGNADWNYSAPHGAGRLMSRSKAKETISIEDFKETMKGVYTTSVQESTIDEAPMAYKPIEEIIENVGDTVDIIDVIRPIYNFKSK